MHEPEMERKKEKKHECETSDLYAWPQCGLSVSRLTAIGNEVHSPFLWSVKTMTAVVVLVPAARGVQISFRGGVCNDSPLLVPAPSSDN
jgi:hypothetical protein